MRRYTKTFVENLWYLRLSPKVYREIPKSETQEGLSIDEQVQAWVNETGHVIIHPGQIGMHTSWHGDATDPYKIKCITVGLTVLYQEAGHGGRQYPIQHADPSGADPGASTIPPGTHVARQWGDGQRSVDGPRPAHERTGYEEARANSNPGPA